MNQGNTTKKNIEKSYPPLLWKKVVFLPFIPIAQARKNARLSLLAFAKIETLQQSDMQYKRRFTPLDEFESSY